LNSRLHLPWRLFACPQDCLAMYATFAATDSVARV
jgi:hypothetical protein